MTKTGPVIINGFEQEEKAWRRQQENKLREERERARANIKDKDQDQDQDRMPKTKRSKFGTLVSKIKK